MFVTVGSSLGGLAVVVALDVGLTGRVPAEGARELGGVAGLLAVHALVPLHPLGVTLGVVRDGRRGVARGLLGQEIGAEETGVDDGGGDAEGLDLGLERLHPAL